MIKPNFETFRYRGTDFDGNTIEKEAVERTVDERTRQYAPSADGQELAVFTTVPQNLKHQEIVVRATAFSDDNGRSDGAYFDAYLAEATGRMVMAVNTPGVDYYAETEAAKRLGQLTPDQAEELRMIGSFSKVGAASMRALKAASLLNGTENNPYIITGSSMGIGVSGGMLSEAFDSNSKIAGVVWEEPVNHVRRPFLRLGAQFLGANGTAGGYVAMNPSPIDKAEPGLQFMNRVRDGRKANLRYAMALAAGTLLGDLGPIDALADMKIPFDLGRGSASSLSGGEQAFADLVAHLKPNDSLVARVHEGHDHPYTMTVQSVIDGVDNVTSA